MAVFSRAGARSECAAQGDNGLTMGRYVFKLPDVGEGLVEAEISHWHVAAGDRIREDEPLVDVTTDKAVVEIPAPASGIVVSIHGAVGEKVGVGAELAVIETEAERNSGSSDAAAQATVPAASAAPVEAAKPRGHALAAPAVRQRARELGVELQLIRGSGPSGRVTHADLDTFLRGSGKAPARKEAVEEHRVVGIRRKIAERVQEAKRRIPHFSYIEEVDVTALEELRLHLNDTQAGKRPKLTPLPFLMRALALALPAHPEINARFDDEKGVVHRYSAVHIGIATQTPNGLLVPVVRHVEIRELWDCAAEAARLAAAAREGRATRDELSGSTITITSLGALGGVASTPVINYPEVAIVGVNRITERPVVRSAAVVVRKMMNLSSSFDHRVVDGWHAAEFIQKVKSLLEQPATLFMD
jgi:2-oxoisovalerate dehydrogenase E2 component (dihydrolipoyl transacylase)